MEYVFESEQFALSHNGLHLLRNGYNFQTYINQDISEIIIERGRLINRWLIILLFGVALIAGSLYYTIQLYLSVNNGVLSTIYIEQIVVPFLPLFLGAYCLYWSLRSGPCAKVVFDDGKIKSFPLDMVEKNRKLEILISHLKQSEQLRHKSTINI